MVHPPQGALMPKTPREKKRNPKPDMNKVAFRTLQIATGELPNPDKQTDVERSTRGRKGGLKGGKSRMEKLTAKERSALAKSAAKARWGRNGK